MLPTLRTMGEPYVSAGCERLDAIPAKHLDHFRAVDTQRLTGSIDLDAALSGDPEHGRANRWDYGVGFSLKRSGQRCAVWVEVHSGGPGELSRMTAKRDWLVRWLRRKGKPLEEMTAAGAKALGGTAIVWVVRGNPGRPGAPWRLQAVEQGIQVVPQTVTIP